MGHRTQTRLRNPDLDSPQELKETTMRVSKTADNRLTVAVIGDIEAGSRVTLRENPDAVDLGSSLPAIHKVWPSLVALEVMTDQVMPIARIGDLILFEPLQDKIDERHFGMPVFYKTRRGEHGFRHLHHTENRGLYNLVAPGLMAPPLLNIRLEQVARMALTVPRELLAHVTRVSA